VAVLSPAPALTRGRTAAEALMVDACTIQHRTGETTDGELGTVVPTYAQVYAGKCKVQRQSRSGEASASPTDVGEAGLLIGRLEVHVPMAVTGVAADDVVTITASALDPALVGQVYTVRGVLEKSFATARRLAVIEVKS
jgi:hypothetical protein